MPKLKIVSAKKLIRFLKSQGFIKTRQSGSHIILVKGSVTLSVPLHSNKDLGRGLILGLLKDAEIEPDFYQNNV